MTTALYRRYRPETFAEVIGQSHVTEPLMAALAADRVTHAYLFSGPRGSGKTTSARILARCLNCAKAPTAIPCGQCDSCRELAVGGSGSLDVVEIDAASHNGVDDARELRERATFAPARDRFKIFILDEAHMVTAQGFNALLKLVEEPPEHVKFVFATTEPEKVIGTIRSRTHHYPFRLVPPEQLEQHLQRICDAEGVTVGTGVIPLVVRAGAGSVRDSLSVLDQLIAGSLGSLDYAQAVALLGYTDAVLLDSVIEAVAVADGAGVFGVVDQIVESGQDPRRFAEDLLVRLRDLLVIEVSGAAAPALLPAVPKDQYERMQAQARQLGAVRLSLAADLTNAALMEMTGVTSPRLQLELLFARVLVTMAGAAGAVALPVAQVVPVAPVVPVVPVPPQVPVQAQPPAQAQPEQRAAQSAPPVPEHPNVAQQAPQAPQAHVPQAPSEPKAPVAPQTGQAQNQDPLRLIHGRWEEVLGCLGNNHKGAWAMVAQWSMPVEVNNGVLIMQFRSNPVAHNFMQRQYDAYLSAAIKEVLGLQLAVKTRLESDGQETNAAAGTPGQASPPPRPAGTPGSGARRQGVGQGAGPAGANVPQPAPQPSQPTPQPAPDADWPEVTVPGQQPSTPPGPQPGKQPGGQVSGQLGGGAPAVPVRASSLEPVQDAPNVVPFEPVTPSGLPEPAKPHLTPVPTPNPESVLGLVPPPPSAKPEITPANERKLVSEPGFEPEPGPWPEPEFEPRFEPDFEPRFEAGLATEPGSADLPAENPRAALKPVAPVDDEPSPEDQDVSESKHLGVPIAMSVLGATIINNTDPK